MSRQIQSFENVKQILKSVPHEQIFSEIDFFNNGYIDADSLVQFINHFNNNSSIKNKQNEINQLSNQQQLANSNEMHLRCSQLIKYLKGSATAQKIFYVDFVVILQQNMQQLQNPEQQNMNSPHSLTLSRSIGHIARVNDIQGIQSVHKKKNSQIHNIDQSNFINFASSNGSQAYRLQLDQQNISQIKGKPDLEDIQKIHKIMSQQWDPRNYEQKICSNHWRNNKYLSKLKIETNITNFKPYSFKNMPNKSNTNTSTNTNTNIYIQKSSNSRTQPIHLRKAKQKFNSSFFPSKQQNQPPNSGDQIQIFVQINSSEILYQLNYLAQVYYRHHKEVQTFLDENKNFTFINGFNVIDLDDKGYVTQRDVKQFFVQIQLSLNDNKIQHFFKLLSRQLANKETGETKTGEQIDDKVIYYHSFAIKIFRLKSLESLFQKVRKRKPLILQQWPQEQKRNYCRFIRNIVTIFYDISIGKQTLIKMLKLNTKYNSTAQILQVLKQRMEQIFNESQIHHEKLREILGKNSSVLINQLYKDEVILQPATLLSFFDDSI